jgi:hypothetical protein
LPDGNRNWLDLLIASGLILEYLTSQTLLFSKGADKSFPAVMIEKLLVLFLAPVDLFISAQNCRTGTFWPFWQHRKVTETYEGSAS